jgi:hypothetical protein
MTTTTACPSAARCLDVLLHEGERAPVECGPPGAAARAGVLEWLRSLRGDNTSLGVLDQARESGVVLPRVLIAAVWLQFDPTLFNGPLYVLSIPSLEGRRLVPMDIDETLRGVEKGEHAVKRRCDVGDELRGIRALLRYDQRSVRRKIGSKRRGRARDGKGRFRDVTYRVKGSFVAPLDATVAPLEPALGAGRGRRGDQELNVMTHLLIGHMRHIGREVRADFIAKLLVHGLKLGDPETSANPAEAMRRRVHHAIEHPREDAVKRAQTLARILRLSLRLD